MGLTTGSQRSQTGDQIGIYSLAGQITCRISTANDSGTCFCHVRENKKASTPNIDLQRNQMSQPLKMGSQPNSLTGRDSSFCVTSIM
ncbi:hypothetical protein NPIL_198461 [Nephila pilipes]|uniref:Uncharacterized protein n=1 Tax=Nephila pilipes TaxID=299642 RepID=A0A8X6PTL4_NEPPI|nr:hypothetical protein NPIL_198461 [Nephila pilipes]